MPWYAAISFTAYAMLLIWQAVRAMEIGRHGLLAIPYLLVKLGVMLVALAYWDPDFCLLAFEKPSTFVVLLGAVILCQEAFHVLKSALMNPMRRIWEDNYFIAVSVLASVVLPGAVLFFASSVVLASRCTSYPK